MSQDCLSVLLRGTLLQLGFQLEPKFRYFYVHSTHQNVGFSDSQHFGDMLAVVNMYSDYLTTSSIHVVGEATRCCCFS